MFTKFFDEEFIRVTNSPIAVPVLFVKKPGDGLRFYMDYWNLNRFIKKDRYPLSLIYEILMNIRRARWFIKFDIITTFHKIHINVRDE
jgi:CRISPR/Cas system endoribonuclease Cas6 (RAMP superfamily)